MVIRRVAGRGAIFYLLLLLCSCHQEGKKAVTLNQQEEHALPNADTASLATESELLQIWEDYDFRDTMRINDPNDSEQKLVDFIASFPNYSTERVYHAIHSVLKRAEENKTVLDFFNAQFAHYLYDPNSPMRSDLYYQPVLQYLTTSTFIADTEKTRYKMQLAVVQKNQPGFPINDFTYFTSQSVQTRFSSDSGIWKILIFYDPTCTHCGVVIAELKSNEKLNELIRQKQLRVLAIDPVSTGQNWQKHKNAIPKNWVNGLDRDKNIIKNQLFSLRAYPTIYLVNDHDIVVLKDCDVDALQSYLLRL